MLASLAVVLGLLAGFNYLVNPFRAWAPKLIDDRFVRIDLGEERRTTPYRVRNETPSVLLVGTSRVMMGMWIEQGARGGVSNVGLPAGNLHDAAALIRLAMHNPELRRVVWGVDFTSFGAARGGFSEAATKARLDGDDVLRVRETLLSLEAVEKSGQLVMRAIGGAERLPPRRLWPVPWPADAVRRELAAVAVPSGPEIRGYLDDQINAWLDEYEKFRRSDEQWALFRDTVQGLREAAVTVDVLVMPMSIYDLETLRQTGHWPDFLAWKRELAAFTPYWDFSGYGAVAENDALFDVPTFCHFKPPVGHAILRRLLTGNCDDCGALARDIVAGAAVNPLTVEAHLAAQDAGRLAAEQARPRAMGEVARIADARSATAR